VKKHAFTMIELIIIIVVVGILSAAVMPRLERDTLRDAANQVVRHIQYTQHLAMVDDVYNDTDNNWYLEKWQIGFRTTNRCYVVYSDLNQGGFADANEAAIDPLDKTLLFSNVTCTATGNNTKILLATEYDINAINLSGGCGGANNYIAFDNLGRPHVGFTGPVNNLMVARCDITLTSGARNAVVSIDPETGYTRITAIN
jgi:type II secretory pathway pseudopilin PulG